MTKEFYCSTAIDREFTNFPQSRSHLKILGVIKFHTEDPQLLGVTTPYKIGGCFAGVKWPERKANHSRLSRAANLQEMPFHYPSYVFVVRSLIIQQLYPYISKQQHYGTSQLTSKKTKPNKDIWHSSLNYINAIIWRQREYEDVQKSHKDKPTFHLSTAINNSQNVHQHNGWTHSLLRILLGLFTLNGLTSLECS